MITNWLKSLKPLADDPIALNAINKFEKAKLEQNETDIQNFSSIVFIAKLPNTYCLFLDEFTGNTHNVLFFI